MTAYTFKATLSANQTGIADDTFTHVAFDTATLNQGNFFNTSTGGWMPPAGNVDIQAQAVPLAAGLAVSSTTSPQIRILKNGSPLNRSNVELTRLIANAGTIFVSAKDVSNGSDVYSVDFKAPSGSTLSLSSNGTQTNFQGMVIA